MDLKSKCRICFCQDKSMQSLVSSITPKIESTTSVIGLWNIYSRLLSTNDPAYPDRICTECIEKVQQTYIFLDKCEKSETYLHRVNEENSLDVNEINEFMDISEYKKNVPNSDFGELLSSFSKESPNCFKSPMKLEEVEEMPNQLDESLTNFTISIDDSLMFEIRELTKSVNNPSFDKTQTAKCIQQSPQGGLDKEPHNLQNEIFSDEIISKDSFDCLACSFQCRAVERLEKHIVAQHIYGNFCKICSKAFIGTSLNHCSLHLKKPYPQHKKSLETYNRAAFQFECEFCLKPFRSKAGYTYHLLMKHGCMDENEKIFNCPGCPKYFVSKSAMESHARVHSGIKPFMCKFCSKKFVQKGHLIVHLRRHTGERPYKCKLCPKSFPDKSNYNKHLILHSGNRPYKCNICPQAFFRKNLLNIHLLDHANMKSKWKDCGQTISIN